MPNGMSDLVRNQSDLSLDKPKEECGIIGVFAPDKDVARLAYYGLYALQHRGQESAGITVVNDGKMSTKKDMGLVSEIFNEQIIDNLNGISSIGHVRYSTEGDSSVINAQPLTVTCKLGQLSLSHNGNLINAGTLRKKLEQKGTIFQTTTDSEILAHLLARSSQNDVVAALEEVVSDILGAFSFVVLTPEKLIGFRDPNGFRPLSLGKIEGGYVLASETCAFDTIGAKHVRDIAPGEMVAIDSNGVFQKQILTDEPTSLCVFEYIYFARPDSNLEGKNVHFVRKELGKEAAKEISVSADIVSGVPDSSLSAASGVAEQLGLPYEMGLIKNRYIGRTFINPSQDMRDLGVKLKLNPVEKTVSGKRIILVDDSIVRGTTIGKLVKMLRNSGAKEIHVVITSPPVKYPCCYGIDTSSSSELIAANHSIENITSHIGADSLHFLTIEGVLKAVGSPSSEDKSVESGCALKNQGYCKACFDGDYPILEGDN